LFDYGNCELKGEFVLSVIAMALLLRVYAITRALHAATKAPKPPPEPDASQAVRVGTL
jgi:hypothetical protein